MQLCAFCSDTVVKRREIDLLKQHLCCNQKCCFEVFFFFLKKSLKKYTLFIYTSIHLTAIIVLEKCSNGKKKGRRPPKIRLSTRPLYDAFICSIGVFKRKNKCKCGKLMNSIAWFIIVTLINSHAASFIFLFFLFAFFYDIAIAIRCTFLAVYL